MVQITSAIAAKNLRKLNDQRDVLLAMEKKARSFTAAIQENVESVRPAYDYKATQKALTAVEGKIRALKHTLNCFNSTYVIPEFDMTIDQMLIYMGSSYRQLQQPYQTTSDEKTEKAKGKGTESRIH